MKAIVSGGTKADKKLKEIQKKLSGKLAVFVGLPKNGPRYTYYGGEKNRRGKTGRNSTNTTRVSTKKSGTKSKRPQPPLVAQVAFWNEFGSDNGHIPERSFLRSTIKKNHKKYIVQEGIVVRKVIEGSLDLKTGLGKIGAMAVGDVQKTIFHFKTPGNAPATIAIKGFDAPLRDTSLLAQSIRWEIKKV